MLTIYLFRSDDVIVLPFGITEKYTDVNVVWEAFQNLFTVTGGLLSYGPVFRDYFVQTLQELKDDNVQYLELRGLLLPVGSQEEIII